MRIGIIGYGKMGRAIASIAEERGHTIFDTIDIHNQDSLNGWTPDEVDAAIEFTVPNQAFDNIKQCIKQGIPVVSGTTGWLDRKPELDEYCRQEQGTYFYASNYSLGVNITFKVNQYLARIMNAYPDFAVSMEEIHHTQKKDAPSGTAITLAEGIIKEMDRVNRWTLDPSQPEGSITISSIREGTVPGTHTVQYHSQYDEITLKHKALSRHGFALGAVLVTEWIQKRKGVLTMDDFLDL
jgi:4-hydroxy-tetrahydrodipicolinate reductase